MSRSAGKPALAAVRAPGRFQPAARRKLAESVFEFEHQRPTRQQSSQIHQSCLSAAAAVKITVHSNVLYCPDEQYLFVKNANKTK